MQSRAWTTLLACATTLTAGCSFFRPPAGVKQVGPDQVFEDKSAFVLSNGELSEFTRTTLHFANLSEHWDAQPRGALAELHRLSATERSRDGLFSLAELSFDLGRRREDADCFLAAAVYAWLWLFDDELVPPPDAFDPRFQRACELYNRSLLEAFATGEDRRFGVREGRRELPVGSLVVSWDPSTLAWPLDTFERLLPTADYRVWGLSLRLRRPGLGVALAGLPAVIDDDPRPSSQFLWPGAAAPMTGLLRIAGGLGDMEGGLVGSLELHVLGDTSAISVAGQSVPLEYEPSAALAWTLQEPSRLGGAVSSFFRGRNARRENGIFLLEPYRPGRIPVVFVHGTASSPVHWGELFNFIWSDYLLRERYQGWFFRYDTGNPIAYSAASLRDALREVVAALDPEGLDPALRQMIVIGHSQGGLLAKMMVVDGGEEFLVDVLGTSLVELDLKPESEELLRWALEFEALPSVERVVFMSTPHRGSFLTKGAFAGLIEQFMSTSRDVEDAVDDLLQEDPELPRDIEREIPTSVDNMKPSNRFLNVLADCPVAPGVAAHSIIAIGDGDPADPAGADDGVVAYPSAHVDYALSEVLVPSGHSCQSHPVAIQEVRRILLEHLESLPDTAP